MAKKKTKESVTEFAEVTDVVTENVTEVTGADVFKEDVADVEKAVKTDESTKTAVTEASVVKKKVRKFSKESILRFEKYSRYRDLLGAVLEDNKRYSVDEVDLILKEDD